MPPKKSHTKFTHQKKKSSTAAVPAPPSLNLKDMPEGVLSDVLSYFDEIIWWPTFHSLRVTCKTLNKTMQTKGLLPKYEYDKNIILHFLGGGDGLVKIISILFCEFWINPDCFPIRGDGLVYFAETIQAEICAMMKKALAASKHRLKYQDVYPPEVNADDLRLVDAMAKIDCLQIWPEYKSDCTYHEHFLEAAPNEAKWRLIRALGFQCGIVKMSDDVFPLVWGKMVDILNAILCGLPTYVYGWHIDVWKDMTAEDYQELKCKFPGEDLRMRYSPPVPGAAGVEFGQGIDVGVVDVVIVPGQIRDAAVRVGIRPVMGYQQLGCGGWATTNGRTKKEEIEEAINRYKISPLFHEEEGETMSIEGLNLESDGDFEGDSDLELSVGSQHELDGSFFED